MKKTIKEKIREKNKDINFRFMTLFSAVYDKREKILAFLRISLVVSMLFYGWTVWTKNPFHIWADVWMLLNILFYVTFKYETDGIYEVFDTFTKVRNE